MNVLLPLSGKVGSLTRRSSRSVPSSIVCTATRVLVTVGIIVGGQALRDEGSSPMLLAFGAMFVTSSLLAPMAIVNYSRLKRSAQALMIPVLLQGGISTLITICWFYGLACLGPVRFILGLFAELFLSRIKGCFKSRKERAKV